MDLNLVRTGFGQNLSGLFQDVLYVVHCYETAKIDWGLNVQLY